MSERKILIEVYGGTNKGRTSNGISFDGCGSTLPMKKSVDLFIKELQIGCTNKVEVRYIDTDQKGLKSFPLIDRVVKSGYIFPITVIDGKPRWAGEIDVDKIKRFLYGRLL